MTNGTKKESKWYHNSFLRVTVVSAGLLFGTAAILKNCGPGTPTCPPNSSLVCLKSKEPIAEPPRKAPEKVPPKTPEKGPTKVVKETKQPEKPGPTVQKPEDKPAVTAKIPCKMEFSREPTAEEHENIRPVIEKMEEGMKQNRDVLLTPDGRNVCSTALICENEVKAVSASVEGAKEHNADVLSAVRDSLANVEARGTITTPLKYTLCLKFRKQ